ncbi:serine protease [Microbispora sp. NPDC049125]|uniref:trypsin-like serine peptidase n=1 Tax=Microbispora sp. NPDC049125 TaxID=3154929 RepID=UPI003467BF3D
MKRFLTPCRGVAAMASLLVLGTPAPARAYDTTATHALATEAQALSAVAYWLRDGGRAFTDATPYDGGAAITAGRAGTGGADPDGRAGLIAGIAHAGGPAATSRNVNLPKTTGKAFFVAADDRPHWCAATSVRSDYGNLVATAGHCVYDTLSGAATLRKWVFVPGSYQGRTPWGVYAGKQAFTHFDFATYGDVDRDYAFVSVYNGLTPSRVRLSTRAQVAAFTGPKYKLRTGYAGIRLTDAGRLGDRVGGQGLAYNLRVGTPVAVIGYPAGATVHTPARASATPSARVARSDILARSYGSPFAAQDLALKADELVAIRTAAPSASGSSWLAAYRSSRGLGYLNGLTVGVSRTGGRAGTSFSPYFDGELLGVYDAARHQWTGSLSSPNVS